MSKSTNTGPFSHKVRVRSCGILIENDAVLLLKHVGIGSAGYIWSPPGGGVEFGHSAESTVVREFKEETGLEVQIQEFLFTNEFFDHQHHAIELFFQVKRISGELKLGYDPELSQNQQILTELKWFDKNALTIASKQNLHNIFQNISDPISVRYLKGFFKFENISIK